MNDRFSASEYPAYGRQQGPSWEDRLLAMSGTRRLPPLILTRLERLAAWSKSKVALQAEIKDYRRRLHAMMTAKEEALSNALLFENEDITRWLQDIASSDKGALGVRVKELEERAKEVEKSHGRLVASEQKAWKTVDAVLDAWQIAAKKEWVELGRPDPSLPETVLDALREWIERDVKKPPEP
jgi:hypothetical protein